MYTNSLNFIPTFPMTWFILDKCGVNNICPIHWIQLLQFDIEVSLMQKIEKFFFFIPTFPMAFEIHPYQFKACKVINVYKFFEFYSYISHDLIYIGQMWRQIIFVQFIEFNCCNSTLKLVLCRKLKSFFDSYISHDFLDSFLSIQSM